MNSMDQDLQLLYSVRDKFSEVTYKSRSNQSLGHVYVFRNGVSEGVPSGREGSITVEGMDENIKYTLDKVRGNPLLRMSHSFDEIDRALSSDDSVTF